MRGVAAPTGVESIDLYQYHRPDPDVPYAESLGAFKDLHDAGLVQRVGLSNADPDQIRLGVDVLGDALVSVQNQFSPAHRDSRPELDLCAELGLAFLPWAPLGGMRHAGELGTSYDAFARVAEEHAVSTFQVCLAWELAQGPGVIPIPGASRPGSVRDSMTAVGLVLSSDDLAALTAPT